MEGQVCRGPNRTLWEETPQSPSQPPPSGPRNLLQTSFRICVIGRSLGADREEVVRRSPGPICVSFVRPQAKRLRSQWTGKTQLQVCPLFNANREEVQHLAQWVLEHKEDLPVKQKAPAPQTPAQPPPAAAAVGPAEGPVSPAKAAGGKSEWGRKGDKKSKKKEKGLWCGARVLRGS